MKQWLSGLLAVVLLVSLTACGGGPPSGGESAPPEEEKIDLPVENPNALEDPDTSEETPDPEDSADPEKALAPEASGSEIPAETPAETPGLDTPEAAEPSEKEGNAPLDNQAAGTDALPENGSYTTKDDVALYIHTYGHLPDNFITKKEAQDLGWPGGYLEPYAPGMCIGGSRFGNYEGLLPAAKGRTYTECDIDTLGARSRGAKRIVFSNDGLVYYTEDHYESFELLYGDEGNG